jgi:uncharacterized protein (DUF983 family)
MKASHQKNLENITYSNMENNQSNINTPRVSQWSAITGCKCPRCRVGNAFNGYTYSIKGQQMNEICPACGLKFEREPGYFYVAMFVSYAFNCAEMIAVCIAAYVLGLELTKEHIWYYVGLIIGVSIVFAPFNYRYSRMVLLYWLSPGLHYEPNRIKHVK